MELTNKEIYDKSIEIRNWVNKASNKKVLLVLRRQQLKLITKAKDKKYAQEEYVKTNAIIIKKLNLVANKNK